MRTGLFYRPETIERRASGLLAQYQQKGHTSLTLPIPVEHLAECVLDLGILWDVLPEQEGQTILAGLAPRKRLIVLNEARLPVFDATPGLYRTVLAHEIGHWELHADKAAFNQAGIPGIQEELQFLFRSEQQSWDERNAHLFMSYLLVPHELLSPLISDIETFDWPLLYRLRDKFGVTISSIRVRLERMGLLYVDPQGGVHRSRAEYEGQRRMT